MVLVLAMGKAAPSPRGHRQLRNLALHSPGGWCGALHKLLSAREKRGWGYTHGPAQAA